MNGNKPSTSGMSKVKRNVVLRQHADKERNEWKKSFYSMRKQRDELLAALKMLLNSLSISDEEGLMEHVEVVMNLREAISKAEQS
jgi:hypothetical protein